MTSIPPTVDPTISIPEKILLDAKRFSAGKLLMISPKHQEAFVQSWSKVSFKIWHQANADEVAKYSWMYKQLKPGEKNVFPGLGEQSFHLVCDRVSNVIGTGAEVLVPGRPIILLEDPIAVTNTDFYTSPYGGKNEGPKYGYYIRFLYQPDATLNKEASSVGYALVPQKIWRNYLCLFVDRRAAKYGL